MSLLPQATHATSRDPNSSGSGRSGGLGGQPRSGEYGTVIAYFADTYTSTVHTRRGVLKGVPRLRSTPGQVSALEPGTEVLLSYDYGDPIILGLVTRLKSQDADTVPFSVVDVSGFGGEGENKDLSRTGGTYRLPGEPTSCMPGDWVQTSSDGNMLGVLAGGVNVMRSSAFAQIRTHLLNDLVEVFSRNYRHVTDMGEFTIKNENGRVNMRFRGGSDQKTEAGSDEENWSIKFDLGSDGDMLNLEFCTPKGQTLFKFHVDSDGQCEIYGINGVSINSGAANKGVSAEESTGNKAKKIHGNQSTVIDGSDTLEIGGNAKTAVTGNAAMSSGNDVSSQAARDYAISSGRSFFLAAQGTALGNAVVFDIDSGDWVVDIGGPLSLNPLSGYKMTTWAGNMEFTSMLAGNFVFNSLLGKFNSNTLEAKLNTLGIPNSVILGGPALTSHVVKYEQLQAHLLQLYAMLDTHTHPVVGTAGPFPVVGTATPLPQFTAGLSASLPLLQSVTTGVAL
jgi:hypothetical protein